MAEGMGLARAAFGGVRGAALYATGAGAASGGVDGEAVGVDGAACGVAGAAGMAFVRVCMIGGGGGTGGCWFTTGVADMALVGVFGAGGPAGRDGDNDGGPCDGGGGKDLGVNGSAGAAGSRDEAAPSPSLGYKA